ncbi:MAG: hypothetical protein QW103_02725 [Candidatus Pacearchaeota archaeon]
MNKKAAEKIFSLWWFICLALVGIVVTIAVINHFSSPIDIRAQEISLLQQKILDCVIKNGYLKGEVLSWNKDDFFENCNLNEERFKEEKNSFLFLHLRIKNESVEEIKKFRFGEFSYEEECLIKQKGFYLPICSETKFVVNYFNEKENKKTLLFLELFTASQNHGNKKSFVENEKK